MPLGHDGCSWADGHELARWTDDPGKPVEALKEPALHFPSIISAKHSIEFKICSRASKSIMKFYFYLLFLANTSITALSEGIKILTMLVSVGYKHGACLYIKLILASHRNP